MWSAKRARRVGTEIAMVIVRQLMIRRRRAAGVTAISTAGGRQWAL
jgi:hypothetical protein